MNIVLATGKKNIDKILTETLSYCFQESLYNQLALINFFENNETDTIIIDQKLSGPLYWVDFLKELTQLTHAKIILLLHDKITEEELEAIYSYGIFNLTRGKITVTDLKREIKKTKTYNQVRFQEIFGSEFTQ